MAKLIIVARDGMETEVDGQEGLSVMEIIRDSGSEELLALCGGCCSCATCHIYLDPAFTEQVPAMGGDEDALLDSTDHRRPSSRLACQVCFTAAMDGLRVTIAPED